VLSLLVAATPAALEEISAYASGLAERAGFDGRDGYRLRLILEELVTNVATHAASGPEPAMIRLTGWWSPGRVRLRIVDTQQPFDPVGTPLTDPDGRLGGYGLMLVRAAADRLEYRWQCGGNVTTVLVEHRPADGGGDGGGAGSHPSHSDCDSDEDPR
jgi:anti-sigma regulatory factor (Ser/Thr protein kinase)